MQANERYLRITLKLNAAFSILSGLLLVFNKPMIDKMGIGNYTTPMIVGMGLVVFGCYVLYQSLIRQISIQQVRLIILSDLIWVLVSIVVLLVRPWSLSSIGYGLIMAVAVTVGLFGFFQNRYLKPLSHQ